MEITHVRSSGPGVRHSTAPPPSFRSTWLQKGAPFVWFGFKFECSCWREWHYECSTIREHRNKLSDHLRCDVAEPSIPRMPRAFERRLNFANACQLQARHYSVDSHSSPGLSLRSAVNLFDNNPTIHWNVEQRVFDSDRFPLISF